MNEYLISQGNFMVESSPASPPPWGELCRELNRAGRGSIFCQLFVIVAMVINLIYRQ